MKKKLVTSLILGIMAFSSINAYANENSVNSQESVGIQQDTQNNDELELEKAYELMDQIEILEKSKNYSEEQIIELRTKLFNTLEKIDEETLRQSPRGIYKYRVTGNNVRVRRQPSTTSTVLGHMNWGDVIYTRENTYRDTAGTSTVFIDALCGSPLTGVNGYISRDYVAQDPNDFLLNN